MTSRRRFLQVLGASGVAGLVFVAGIGCAGSADDPDAPPAIRYGQERCFHCGMVIDDLRFASASRMPGEASRHFDDIGCLLADLRPQPASATRRTFVHDIATEAWLRAPEATYLISSAIRTPMASGIVAAADEGGIRDTAAQYPGEVHNWASIQVRAEQARTGGHAT